jgi:hypothetical protein
MIATSGTTILVVSCYCSIAIVIARIERDENAAKLRYRHYAAATIAAVAVNLPVFADAWFANGYAWIRGNEQRQFNACGSTPRGRNQMEVLSS